MDFLIQELLFAKLRCENLKQFSPNQVLYYDLEKKNANIVYDRMYQAFLLELNSVLPTFCYLLRMLNPRNKVIVDGVSVESKEGKKHVLYLCLEENKESISKSLQELISPLLSLDEILNLFYQQQDCLIMTCYNALKKPKYFTNFEFLAYSNESKANFAVMSEHRNHPWYPFVKMFLEKIIESGVIQAKNGTVSSTCFVFPTIFDTEKSLIRVPNIL